MPLPHNSTECIPSEVRGRSSSATELSDIYASELVQGHLDIVNRECRRISKNLPSNVSFEDIVSAGTVGLIEAAQKYDSSRGVPFSAFCLTRIRGAVQDELRRMDWLPRAVRGQATRVDEANRYLWMRLQRKPTMFEVAERIGVNSDEFSTLLCSCSQEPFVSIFLSQGDDTKNRLVDSVADESVPSPSDRLQRLDLLRTATKGLKQRERLILILYYYEGLTMKEVGAALGIGLSRVSALHHEIILRLRDSLTCDAE